jgi:hypothetical protein
MDCQEQSPINDWIAGAFAGLGAQSGDYPGK